MMVVVAAAAAAAVTEVAGKKSHLSTHLEPRVVTARCGHPEPVRPRVGHRHAYFRQRQRFGTERFGTELVAAVAVAVVVAMAVRRAVDGIRIALRHHPIEADGRLVILYPRVHRRLPGVSGG